MKVWVKKAQVWTQTDCLASGGGNAASKAKEPRVDVIQME